MKLLAKDLSNGQTVATTAIDVLTTGKLTTTNVFSGIGLDLATQSSRPANVAKGLWLNNSNALRFYNGTTDYEVAHSGTSLAGDVSGTLGATVVADDSHSHSNTTLTGVPGSGIDTTAIHSGDSTGGDLSGTLPTNITVIKLQTRTVASTAPTDGQILTWNNSLSQWEPQTPSSSATYYVVLDATATHGEINTALSTYDVVYLEPGTYSSVTGQIQVPQKKQLLGLTGGGGTGSSYKPSITLVTSGSVNIEMAQGSAIKGLALAWGNGSTGDMVVSSGAGANCVVEWCDFYGFGAGTRYFAVNGSFKSVAHSSINYAYGINLGTTGTDGGATVIDSIYWLGVTDASYAQNSGVVTSASTRITNSTFTGGYAGIYMAGGLFIYVDNVTCRDQVITGGYGIYASGSSGTPYLCSFSNIYIYSAAGAEVTGFYSTGDYNSYSDIYVFNAGKAGIHLDSVDHASMNNLFAYDCGDAGATYPGINLGACTYCTVGTLGSRGSGTDGIRMTDCAHVTFSGIESSGNAAHGLNASYGNSDCTFGMIRSDSNIGSGVNVGASQTGLHFIAGSTTNNTSYGFLGGNSGTPACRIDSWYSYSNTAGEVSLGTGWLNYVTPMAEPASSATNDILQRTSGGAWDAVGGASGDRFLGTLYGSAVDLAGHLTFTADNTYDIGASGATRPRTGYFGTSAVIAGKTAMKADDSTGGDLSGTYPTTITVAKIQGRTVASTAPSNGQMLTWNSSLSQWEPQTPAGGATTLPQLNDVYSSMSPSDEQVFYYDGGNTRWDAKYPGVVNESGNRTFVILVAGTSATDINTALTNYDVVYLEPGTYSLGSTALSVSAGKKLIGLGDAHKSGSRVTLDWSGSPASRHIYLQDGTIENLYLYLSSTAHTTHLVEGTTTTNLSNIARSIVVNVANNPAATVYAFSGAFIELVDITVGDTTNKMDGLNLTSRPSKYESAGPVVIDRFYIYPVAYGILTGGVDDVSITNGYIFCSGSNYGIAHNSGVNTYRYVIRNVTIDRPAQEGILFTRSSTNYTYGLQISNVSVVGGGVTRRGFYLTYCTDFAIDNCSFRECDYTASLGYGGLIVDGCNSGTISNINTYQHNATSCSGVYTTGSTNLSINNVTSKEDYYGIYIPNSGLSYGTVSNIAVYDSVDTGARLVPDYTAVSNVSVYSAGGSNAGIVASGINSSFTALTARSCATIGVYAGGSYCSYAGLNATGTSGIGVYLYGLAYGSASSVSAYGNSGYGVYVYSCQYSAFSALNGSYNRGSSSYTGVYIGNGYGNSFAGLTAYDNQGYGILFSGSDQSLVGAVAAYNDGIGFATNGGSGISVSGVTAYYNGSHGFYITTNSASANIFGDLSSYGNGGNGVYWYGTGSGSSYNMIQGIVMNSNTGGSWSGGTPSNWAVYDSSNP